MEIEGWVLMTPDKQWIITESGKYRHADPIARMKRMPKIYKNKGYAKRATRLSTFYMGDHIRESKSTGLKLPKQTDFIPFKIKIIIDNENF